MNRFLHIGVNYAGTPVRPEVIDAALNRSSEDWLRYSPCCWIAWSNNSPQDLFENLRPFLTLSDSILITRLDLNERAGFLPNWAWEWIDLKRGINPAPYRPLSSLGGLTGAGNVNFGDLLGGRARALGSILGRLDPQADQTNPSEK